MTDHTAIVGELGDILRGDHRGWEGDRRANGYTFLARIRRDMPEDAAVLASDIDANLADFAEVTGISPSTLRLAVRVLRAETSCL